jgi:hypothetical protein
VRKRIIILEKNSFMIQIFSLSQLLRLKHKKDVINFSNDYSRSESGFNTTS